MKPFDEIWPFTDSIPGSFTRLSGEKLYEYACQADNVIVEVGVDQGRSASLLLESIAGRDISLVLIDSWESVLIDNKRKVEDLCSRFPMPRVSVLNMPSVEAAEALDLIAPIGLLHIDANHYFPNPQIDCKAWLPLLRSGGVACFHDYHESWPAVVNAVNVYCDGWEKLGVWDSLAIRRKP